MPDDFLVEIGAEELPPRLLRTLARDFHDRVVQTLADARLIDPDAASEWVCSPRRLAVRVAAVREREPDTEQDRLGPALAAAFDADGEPTKAAEGFARSCGATVAQLERRETSKGERLAFRQVMEGRRAAEVLDEAVKNAIDRMSIPRRMRWGANDASFVRPVHWLVMLHGEMVIDSELLGVAAGRESRGHRFHHPEHIALDSPASYVQALRETGKVELDDAEGRLEARVQKLADDAATEAGGCTANSSTLAAEVAALAEWPVPLVGAFPEDYLKLPDEVVVAVLEGQQNYFPLRDARGQLLPRFIAFSNIESRDPDAVRRGNERVVRPRLADALFFWKTDRKTPLAARTAALDAVVFQAGLGSLADQAGRIGALAARVAPSHGVDTKTLQRAAALAKCDLMTDMVGEFPELQGVMGRYYAAADGESEAVAAAIGEQYRPQHANDPIPATPLGRRLAIADKLDTIAGAFALGKRPSGTKDPFALRRHAAGVIRIALEAPLDIDLVELIDAAVEAQPAKVDDGAALAADILAFMLDRLRGAYAANGIRGDIVEAVLAMNAHHRPVDIDARIQALSAFVDDPAALALAAANKRSANILRQAGARPTAAPNVELFREPSEKALYQAIENNRAGVSAHVARGNYTGALTDLATLREPVDRFFDDVMVMDEDVKIRANRLALLQSLHELFRLTADWARIQVQHER